VLICPAGSDFPAVYIVDREGLKIDLPRIEHGGSKTGNSTIVGIHRSKNVTISGGPLIGGWSSVFAVDSDEVLLDGLETRQCLVGYGLEFNRCKHPVLRNVKAIGHKCDGVRFLMHNTEPEIDGGEYRDNGSRFESGGVIGVGIHLGQSWQPRIKNRPIVTGNLGNGVCWKASYSPESHGKMEGFEVDGLVLGGNGGNQLEVRWNYQTPGTVRPKGFKAKGVIVHSGRENGIYLDCDDAQVDRCFFADCDRLAESTDKNGNKILDKGGKPIIVQQAAAIGFINGPDGWKPTNTEFSRCPNEVVFYRVDR
jgi:hypothetical protein